MPRLLPICICRAALAAALLLMAGACGTTKWSDTSRTATEQLLISDAVDRAVSEIDFGVLAGKEVFMDTKYINGSVDEKYIIGTLRQHMLASGCIIKDSVEDAAYIVEIRTGAVGTNRNDLLFGVPATSLPTGGMFPIVPTSIPELPLMKRTNQQGICKIAVFAYDRLSGQPVWQSGTRQVASKAKDIWVFGTGPFQSGTIYDGKLKFAGERLTVPLQGEEKVSKKRNGASVAQELLFAPPPASASRPPAPPAVPPSGLFATAPAARSPAVAPAATGAQIPRSSPPPASVRAGHVEPPPGSPPGAPRILLR